MKSRNKPLPARYQCINCNICINTLRRYQALELETQVVTLLCSWVWPRIITQDDYICEKCKNLVISKVLVHTFSGKDSLPDVPSKKGHACLMCGSSTLRKQAVKILRDDPDEQQQAIIDILLTKLEPREVTASDCVCRACWLRTKREVVRMKRQDTTRSISAVEESEEPSASDGLTIEVHPPASNGLTAEEYQPAKTDGTKSSSISSIVLNQYRRAPNSCNKCVFPNCNHTKLHGISDKLRAVVLHNHKYYLPKLARACDKHMECDSWGTLFDCSNSMNTFTVEHIEHVFSFVKATNEPIDFEDILEIDDKLFEYLLGLTKAKFRSILEEVPRIAEMHRGIFGLAALLIKIRRGESGTKIAGLLEVPRRTLENLMDKAREIMLADYVPKNMGIDLSITLSKENETASGE